MLFNSIVFLFAFLPITYVVFWALRSAQPRYVWLTITGYVFYGYWDPRFCLLMAFSTVVSFTAGLGMARWQDPRRRRLCLVIPITVDLLLLGVFKYAGFMLDTVRRIVEMAGGHAAIPAVDIVLPVGISFYTFHTITYIVDCYRGTITPTKNLFEFSAYVSLFSQLVAGPIVRFRQIEQDLHGLGSARRSRWLARGASYFLLGLTEKVLVADALAAFVDPALSHVTSLSSAGAWMAMLGYTFQLYFDFAGYSDMAIGLGLMFGLRIPVNFNSPYKALNPSDFWQRWHISLSTVLRDYLYIPLGGNRRGEWNTYRNLMITMLLGGLWHGANWTFVVWGGYHGLLLALYRKFGAAWDRLPIAVQRAGTLLAVVLGWVFFRSPDFSTAGRLLQRMLIPTAGLLTPEALLAGLALAIAGGWALFGPNGQEIHDETRWRPRLLIPLAAALGACLATMIGTGSSPFLYFQF